MGIHTKQIIALLLTLVLCLSFNGLALETRAEENEPLSTVEATEAPGADPTEESTSASEPEPASEPEEDPVDQVKALLAQIDSLEEMQAYRVKVTQAVFQNAQGKYASANYANNPEAHQRAQQMYQDYVEDMFAKRAAAKEAYEALNEAQKALIAADETAAANLAKLTPYDKLPTHWFTQDRVIIGKTAQTAAQLELPIPVTQPEDPSDPYVFEYLRAYELAMCYSAAGYPCTYALTDTTKSGPSWTPNGFYAYGSSNYELVYCCDSNVNAHRGMHYKRMNLEDSDYFSKESAAHIRSIVQMAYPFVSMEEMRQLLVQKGFDPALAAKLTRSDMIAATQWAIWTYSSQEEDTNYIGSAALIEARDRRDYLLMPSLHDYRNEDWSWYLIAPGDYYAASRYRYTYYEDVKQRVDALTSFLVKLPGTAPEENQIVITRAELARTATIPGESDSYTLDLNVVLNHGVSAEKDQVRIAASAVSKDGTVTWTSPEPLTVDARTAYHLTVKAKDGDTIKIVVDGRQTLPRGAYFYQTAGGPEESQCFVNVAEGETPVHAERSFEFHQEAEMGIRVFKTAAGSERPISGIVFRVYRANPPEGEKLSDSPTQAELEKYAVEENLAGTLTTDDNGYAFLALERGSYLVVELLNQEKVQEAAAPFYVRLPYPVEVQGGNGAVSVKYENVAAFHIENVPVGAVAVKLELTKVFNDWGKAQSFRFTLAPVSQNAPMPRQTTATATKDQPKAVFEQIVFERAGSYSYTITELDEGLDGVRYDKTPHQVTVTVGPDPAGALSAQVRYDGAESLTVTNSFTPAKASIELTKELKGRAWTNTDRFDFVLEAVTEGAPLPAQTKASATKAQPKLSFGEISFDKAGSYRYTVTEQAGSLPGVYYDTVKHQILVTVTKGQDNALTAQVQYDGAQSLTVVNVWSQATAEIKVTKALSGRAWQTADSFVFHLEAVSKNAPKPAVEKAAATKNKPTVSFGTLSFTAPGNYEYRLWEEKGSAANLSYDTKEHRVLVTVTRDQKTGELKAAVSYDGKASLTVTNRFSTPGIPKTGDGHNPILWAAIAAAALAGILLLLRARRRAEASTKQKG